MKVAVTLFAASRVSEQVPVPVQAPDQPEKTDPAAADALSTTVLPLSKAAVQVVPQSMPAGVLVTAPLPAPARVTVTVVCGTKVAVAVLAASTVTPQVDVVPVQAPLQPVKREPGDAVAVRVTTVPVS